MGRAMPERAARRPWRAFARLAGIALLAIVIAERLRWRRKETSSEGSVMLEHNKQIARRVIEDALTKGRLEAIDEVVAPAFVNHDPATGDQIGRDGLRELVLGYRNAFPDLRITIEDQVAEGDCVVTRWTATGTHKGELMGIEATGKQATVSGMTFDRIADGMLVESWNNWDTLGLLRQLGAVPELATA